MRGARRASFAPVRINALLGFIAATGTLLAGLAVGPAQAASAPPVRARSGMVAADNEVASAAGVAILEAGGSAADAAVATALVLGVVNPFASGLGGGGFALYYQRETGEVWVLDFREVAPAAATREMFVVDGDVARELSLWSGLAVGVPGEVAGLRVLHRRFGRLPWETVVSPAIHLAEHGFPVGHTLALRLEEYGERLSERPELARLFNNESGTLVTEGETLRRPDLAATLRAIASQGPEAFYTGPVAEQMVAAVQDAGGVLTMEDLAGYTPSEREPLVGTYRGFTIYAMPPPSSGGTTMLAALNILEGLDLARLGHNSSACLHLLTEALKFGFSDRATYLGDSDFVAVPADRLTDPQLGAERRERIRSDRTLPQDEYRPQRGAPPDDQGTSHLSVVDAERNVVALTTTINTAFGSTIVAGDTGVILNNQMDDFSAQPGVPNIYGLIGTEANAVEAGKRPLSSMSPTLVFRDGQPVMTLGGSGGPAIISATLQVLINVIDHGMNVREAIEAPRIHHQWMPNLLFLERGIPVDVRDNLTARGHVIADPPFGAAVQAIAVDGDWLYGASDPRKAGRTVGY